jgi:hypothetical protein
MDCGRVSIRFKRRSMVGAGRAIVGMRLVLRVVVVNFQACVVQQGWRRLRRIRIPNDVQRANAERKLILAVHRGAKHVAVPWVAGTGSI